MAYRRGHYRRGYVRRNKYGGYSYVNGTYVSGHEFNKHGNAGNHGIGRGIISNYSYGADTNSNSSNKHGCALWLFVIAWISVLFILVMLSDAFKYSAVYMIVFICAFASIIPISKIYTMIRDRNTTDSISIRTSRIEKALNLIAKKKSLVDIVRNTGLETVVIERIMHLYHDNPAISVSDIIDILEDY